VLRKGLSHIPANMSRLDRIRSGRSRSSSVFDTGEIGWLNSLNAARAWGISIQALYKRAHRGTAIGIRTASGRLIFPEFQFESLQTYTGIKRVITRLPSEDPIDRLSFLLSPSDALGGISPLDAIRRQRSAEAEALARKMRSLPARSPAER